MTLNEIPSEIQQVIVWEVRGIQAVKEVLLQLLGELWRSIARSVQDAVVPIFPVLSSSQQDALVTVALVVGGAVAIFLLVEMLLLLVPPRSVRTVRLKQRHR